VLVLELVDDVVVVEKSPQVGHQVARSDGPVRSVAMTAP
jgi:hypothetical protein